MEAQGYSITRPPSSSLWAAFDPVALWHELNGDRRTNFYGVWYWQPTDAPSPIDQWRADADSIPLNPVPTDTIAATAQGELQQALTYAARDVAVGQLFKYGDQYFKKLSDGSFGFVEKFPGTIAAKVTGAIAGTRGLLHSYDRHAAKWFARHGGEASLAAWQKLIETAAISTKIVDWDTRGAKTIGHLARIDGNKWFFVQFFKEGDRAGELATAFIPDSDQLGAILRKLGK